MPRHRCNCQQPARLRCVIYPLRDSPNVTAPVVRPYQWLAPWQTTLRLPPAQVVIAPLRYFAEDGAVPAGAFLLRAVLGGVATGLGTPQLAHGLVLGATTVTIAPAAGFVIEAVLAFFLVTTVLSTAVAGRAGNLAPLAIGMTLTFNIIMGGALTGAPFNPARAFGPMVATGNFTDVWLYMIAPIVGAVIAALVHLGLTRLAREQSMTPRAAATPAE